MEIEQQVCDLTVVWGGWISLMKSTLLTLKSVFLTAASGDLGAGWTEISFWIARGAGRKRDLICGKE